MHDARAQRRLLILGAAGRDFHDFNVLYRDDPDVRVVAFTATQIPHIDDRRYPGALAGPRYPAGIPIHPESMLEELVRAERIDEVVFAYSDVSHAELMHLGSRVLAAGADFTLPGPRRSMLAAPVPVIAVSAVRTGCGKSAVSRWIAERLVRAGRRVAVVRHPMPYGDLELQRVQRFESRTDLDAAACSIEEREEYEPHLAAGAVVFAGVDYAAIAAAAGREAEVIVWDGGNNDFPFLVPDLHICVLDALRPAQVTGYHPGEAVARMADLFVVNKVDTAKPSDTRATIANARAINARAPMVSGASRMVIERPLELRGKRVAVVEDGPSITHGGMAVGAGFLAARDAQAGAFVDPRPYLVGGLEKVFQACPHIGNVLPAVGYSSEDLAALEATLERMPVDAVVVGTPVDLARLIRIGPPVHRVYYDFREVGGSALLPAVLQALARREPELPR